MAEMTPKSPGQRIARCTCCDGPSRWAKRAFVAEERAAALTREVERLRARLTGLSEWIVQHHPEDFRKGLWDAINAADKAALTPPAPVSDKL